MLSLVDDLIPGPILARSGRPSSRRYKNVCRGVSFSEFHLSFERGQAHSAGRLRISCDCTEGGATSSAGSTFLLVSAGNLKESLRPIFERMKNGLHAWPVGGVLRLP